MNLNSHTILLPLPSFLFQLYYITAWKSQEQRRREEQGGRRGGSSSDLPPEGGDTVIEEPSAVCQLLLLLPIAPSPLPLFLPIILTFFPSLSLPLSSSASLSCLAGSVFSGVFHRALVLFLLSSLIRLFSVSFLLSLFTLIYSHFQLCANFLHRLVMEALRELSIKSDKSIVRPFKSHTRHFLFCYIPSGLPYLLPTFVLTPTFPFCPGEPGGEASCCKAR